MSMATTDRPRDGKPFTGRSMLVWLLSFFGVIFAANVALVWLALGSFPGLEVQSSYRAGQEFSQEVAAAAAQAARGWNVNVWARRDGDRTTVTASFADKAKAPERDLVVTVKLQHPTDSRHDRTLVLAEVRPGVYEAVTAGLNAGSWTLIVDAAAAGERLFRSRNPVIL
jgi:nitrogen fixation protein FixH